MDEDRVEVDGVPARLFRPKDASALVLLGHRGGQGKDHSAMVELGRRTAVGTGLAVVCIDAANHGERRPDTGDAALDERIVASTVVGPQDATVEDWQSVVGGLAGIGPAVGYLGFSMGAMMGIGVIAAIPSIRAGVLWAAGLPPAGAGADPGVGQRFEKAAADAGRAEILMVNMSDDRFFSPERALALFRLLGGPRKRMMLWPGDHDTEPEEALRLSIDFLNRHAHP